MNKPYFCQIFFLTDWHHKRLKNTIDLLLFYGFFYDHFYGFSESALSLKKSKRKNGETEDETSASATNFSKKGLETGTPKRFACECFPHG